nr:DUF6455 family protein [Marivita hallyeonensis]
MRPPTSVPWKPLGNTGVHYWLVQRMAKRCGIDTAQLFADAQIDQDDWAAMVQTCRACDCVSGCKRLLDQPSDTQLDSAPDECLNAELIALLKTGHRKP